MDTQHPAIEHHYCNDNMTSACKRLLQQQSFTTQDDIRFQLIQLGFHDISQSTVSRLLLRLGVAKVPNAAGKKIYCLTTENEPIQINASIASQVEFVSHNQLVIVIKTHPGGAQLVARLIDMQPHVDILGTVGGNDTVMVAPKDVTRIDQCLQIVKQRLGLK